MTEGQHPSERMLTRPETYRKLHARMYDIHDEVHIEENEDGKITGLAVTPARRPRDYAEAMEEQGRDLSKFNSLPRMPWFDIPVGGGFFFNIHQRQRGRDPKTKQPVYEEYHRAYKMAADATRASARAQGMDCTVRKVAGWKDSNGVKCGQYVVQRTE